MVSKPQDKIATKGTVRGCYFLAFICLALLGLLIAATSTNFDHQWPPHDTGSNWVANVIGFVLTAGFFIFQTAGLKWQRKLNQQLS